MIDPGLTAAQRAVADRVIAEEEAERRHLCITLSGAHAYGFPSPDSDLDLKAVHVEPAARLLGLSKPTLNAERVEVIEGVEIDYSSNEIGGVLAGVLAGNGNYVERILGALVLHASPDLASLKPLVKRALSRRLRRHYLGFARNQLQAAEQKPTAKRVLYVLRTALTGAHALAAGEIVTDVRRLLDEHGFGAARELIEAKRAGERVALPSAVFERWRTELDRALATLERAADASCLPEEPTNAEEIEAWLIELRRVSLPGASGSGRC